MSAIKERAYLDATQEFDSPNRRESLYAMLMAEHDGDALKAKYAYVRARADELLVAAKEAPSKDNRKPAAKRTPAVRAQPDNYARSELNNNDTAFVRLCTRIWRGEEGLAKTYWLWALIVPLPIVVVVSVAIGATMGDAWPAGILFFMLFFITPWTVLTLVGIWRAARVYEGPAAWIYLARLVVVLGMIGLPINILLSIADLG